MVKNYMEVLAEDMIDEVLRQTDACGCDICRNDILAIALNSLKPRYVTSDKGETISKLLNWDQQVCADVTAALNRGAIIVSKNPRH